MMDYGKPAFKSSADAKARRVRGHRRSDRSVAIRHQVQATLADFVLVQVAVAFAQVSSGGSS
jgi:hypothetical protein